MEKQNKNAIGKLTSHCGSDSSDRFTPQPSNGGIHISADIIQTAAIITNARAGVRVFKYSTAFVILQYRSSDIKHKFIIEAVDKSTSMAKYGKGMSKMTPINVPN